MTSIIGIKTNSGPDSIVIGADTQLNIYHEEKLVSLRHMFKIRTGDNWVIAYAGTVTDELRDFYDWLYGKRSANSSKEIVSESIQKAVATKRFIEINDLNAKSRRAGTPIDDLHAFILATNEPELELWHLDEFGNMMRAKEVNKKSDNGDVDLDYLVLGSGEEAMQRYIQEQFDEESLDHKQTSDISRVITLCRGCLDAAHKKDKNTGAIPDLAVLSKYKIETFGRNFSGDVSTAIEERWKKIMALYSQQPTQTPQSSDSKPTQSPAPNV